MTDENMHREDAQPDENNAPARPEEQLVEDVLASDMPDVTEDALENDRPEEKPVEGALASDTPEVTKDPADQPGALALRQEPEIAEVVESAPPVITIPGHSAPPPLEQARPMTGALAALREAEIRLLGDIAASFDAFGESARSDRQRLLEVAEDLRDMFFLVVIIGEFNAGKSSLVNAMLRDRLLPTGITPTTEAIELIKYGEMGARTPEIRPDYMRVWQHPNTGAPGVALVDTPGTGSVFQRHETTAKAFLHRSDLVIFVLSAKRALADTERVYLELAREFGKKIIIVINQVDLLTPQERVEVRRFVEAQVKSLLGLDGLIFMVSARESLESIAAGGVETGGVDALRGHLRSLFSAMPPARQKMLSQLDLAAHLVGKYTAIAGERVKLVGTDREKVQSVHAEFDQQATGLAAQLRQTRASVDEIFEGMRARGLGFINENLSIRKLGRGVSREKLQKDFQDVVIGYSLDDVQQATNQYVNALIDQSRAYWRGVIDRLNRLQDVLESDVSGLDANVYAEQREALQDAIRAAEAEMRSYSSGRVLSDMETAFRSNMGNFTMTAAASVAGVVATVLALAAPGPLIGGAVAAAPLAIPAFILGAPVAVVGGALAIRYYRRMSSGAKRDFSLQIDALQKSYDDALDQLTARERTRLREFGSQLLSPIFARLEAVVQRNNALRDSLGKFEGELTTLRRGIETAN
ncbi:MAG: dynamin family protein [Pleurocapsa minor GSE-CHR-MK-17-07R]|nr:dynamin family protein [Pleurocapsa minor GSE-CHR-MK 17-07R]